MIQAYYRIIESILPFSWAQYDFMKNALLAVVLIAPLFALVGTMVVSKRMASSLMSSGIQHWQVSLSG